MFTSVLVLSLILFFDHIRATAFTWNMRNLVFHIHIYLILFQVAYPGFSKAGV